LNVLWHGHAKQEPEDRALADVSDSQGVGGTQERKYPRADSVSVLNNAKEF